MNASYERMNYLLREHRRLARLARQFKFMRKSVGHEPLSIRASAAHHLVMIEVDLLAKAKGMRR